MKKLKLILIIAILIYTISIIVIYFEGKKKMEQKNTEKSLQEGFGSYGDEESLGCFSGDGKCSTEGTETTVQYCRPNPNTGKGCIDENGNQSYATIIKKRPCQTQCASSKFTVEDGIRVANPENNRLGTGVPPNITSVGCDNIVDKRFGIDLTDNFLGTFNKETLKYPLKTCIPNEKDSRFQGYYQHVSTCLEADGKGSDNCRIVCGRDRNILNLNGFANAKLNKKLLSYFPTEENEEGDIRNVCYDINNKDQIEVLNYPGNVPSDFIYPNKCYRHTNVLDFQENVWPTSGTSNIFNLLPIQTSQDVSYIDLSGDQISQFETYISNETNFNTIISHLYDLNSNQNSYVKIRLGSNTGLLEKIYENTDSGIHASKDTNIYTIENSTYYIHCNNFSKDGSKQKLKRLLTSVSDQNFFTNNFYTNSKTKFFDQGDYFTSAMKAYNSIDERYFFENDDDSLIIPCSIKEFFDPVPLEGGISSSFVVKIGTSTLIGNTSLPQNNDLSHFYIVINQGDSQTRQHVFTKGNVGSSVITIPSNTLFDTYDNIQLESIFKSNSKLDQAINYPVTFSDGPTNFTFDVGFCHSFLTETTFINKLSEKPAVYNYLNIRKNVDNLPASSAYCVFATTPHNNLKGYHYPVYLTKQDDSDITLSFMEFPGIEFKTPPGSSTQGQRSNFYFQPTYFEGEKLLFFNEEILKSTCKYTNNYIKDGQGNRKYFISGIETINSGDSYIKGDIYRLSSDTFSPGYDLDQTGVTNIEEIRNNINEGVSLVTSVIYTADISPTIKTIKVLRGDSAYISGSVATVSDITENEKKVRDYFRMIQYQGFTTDTDTQLIFEPEKHLSLVADFSVFKSPYTLTANNELNFLCYDNFGRARPEGYIANITTKGSKVYTNIACPNKKVRYEVEDQVAGPYCAVKGPKKPILLDKIETCTQERDAKATNFIDDIKKCIVSKDISEYQTINNQLGFGLELRPVQKSLTFPGLSQNTGNIIDNNLNTYPSYFTREYDENRSYGPKEEFYVEKTRNNYFVSLTNYNVNFVENVESWRRVFIFENNDSISPFQYFFNVHNSKDIDNKFNLGLGKFSDTFKNLKTNISPDMNIAFTSRTAGINSQNYTNKSVSYFWGGSRRRTAYDSSLNPDTPGANVFASFFTDYVTQMEDSCYRVEYFSDFFNNPQPSTRGMSVNPNYISLKFSGDVSSTPRLNKTSPIYNTFGVEENEEITFVSSFYDDNIDIPWAYDVTEGDIFNPDATYFNLFFYTFILGNNQNNVEPGIKINPLLRNNFMAYNTSTTDTDIDDSAAIFSFRESITINNFKHYNSPKVSDYILLIPSSFGTAIVTDGALEGYNLDPNFPQFYPTLSIKRIKSIEPTDNGNSLEINFDKKDYSEAKNFNSTNESVYLFNLGKATGNDNLITRCFDISKIDIVSVDTTKYNPYKIPSDVKFLEYVRIAIPDLYQIHAVPGDNGTVQFKIMGGATYAFNIVIEEWDPVTGISEPKNFTKPKPDLTFPKGAGGLSEDNYKKWPNDGSFVFPDGCYGDPNLAPSYWHPDSLNDKTPVPNYKNNNVRTIWPNPAKPANSHNKNSKDESNYTSMFYMITINKFVRVSDTDKTPSLFKVKEATGLRSDPICSGTASGGNKFKLTVSEGGAGVPGSGYNSIYDAYKPSTQFVYIDPEVAIKNGKVSYKGENQATETVSRKYSKFKFKIDSIPQDIMKSLLTNFNASKNVAYTPGRKYTPNSRNTSKTQCYQDKVYTASEWDSFIKTNSSKITSKDIENTVPCFNVGCMPGDPEKIPDGRRFSGAACAAFLDSPGNTNLGCPGGKYWNCIQTQASINEVNDIRRRNEDLLNGGNFLTPALSARYIKKFSQSPYKKMSGYNTFASLYDSSPEESLNIKVISQVTEIAYNLELDGKSYYINEFREDKNYFVKQVSRVFSVGDTFDYYYNTSSSTQILSGNRKFLKILTFRVEKVGVTVRNPEFNIRPVLLDFDYKCSVVLSKDKKDNKTPKQIYDSYFGNDSPDTIKLNNLYAYYIDKNDNKFWRSTLPYTLKNNSGTHHSQVRGVLDGYKDANTFSFGESPSYQSSPVCPVISGTTVVPVPDAGLSEFFLDAYKFNNYSAGTSMVVPKNPFRSPIYTGAAIRSGNVDTIVLTGTQMETDIGQKAYVNVEVTGKPYGVGFFPSSPSSENSMINYAAYGKIKSFSFNKSSVTFPINTILKSSKGFKIKFLASPPPIFEFQNARSPSGEILPYEKGFNYSESEIVNIKDKNLKQYFRNISGSTVPYMKKIDIENPSIPFAYYDSAKTRWLYPVYKKQIPGSFEIFPGIYRKEKLFGISGKENTSSYMSYDSNESDIQRILSGFKIISETVYPEVNFVDYDHDSFYDVDNIVKSDGKLYRSLINLNSSSLIDPFSWEVVDLKQQMVSDSGDKFYTVFNQDDSLLESINSSKNLNNQNLPLLIKYNFDSVGNLVVDDTIQVSKNGEMKNQYEYCPKPCTYYNLSEDYNDSFLKSEYFDSIRYLFQTPTMLTKEGTSFFVSLGNTPVEKSNNYNVGFLQDGGARNNFLSQYLYFINIKDQEEKYNRSSCRGDLKITTPRGFQDTEANKFEFANSLLFNFLPCNLESQDFLKYTIDIGMSSGSSVLVSSDNSLTKNSVNIFPPYGVSCNVLVSSKTTNGMSFRKIKGHFEYSYPLGVGGDGLIFNEDSGRFINVLDTSKGDFFDINKISPGLCYGDPWYIEGNQEDSPFGFIIPDATGGVSTSSFIQLNSSTNYKNASKLKTVPDKEDSSPTPSSKLYNFNLSTEGINNPGNSSGIYNEFFISGLYDTASYYVQFRENGTLLNRGEAIFYPDQDLDPSEIIYLPSYDISKNIKAQAVTIFGESFVGHMGYTLDKDNANYSLDGKQKSTMLFNEFKNDLLLSDIDKRKKEVFTGNNTINLDNVYKTFLINFDKDNQTFSIKPNLYQNPISSPTNKFLYKGGTSSVDPISPITSINSESITVLTSEDMSGLKGVSVNINLEDFLKYNQKYTTDGTCIPGKTNVQLQLDEIRENRTSLYIQDDNKCSIYFEPIVGDLPTKLVTSTWEMKMSNNLPVYGSTRASNSPRFNAGTFLNSQTKVSIKNDINVYLGCNLYYLFNQNDPSNLPVVFSTKEFETVDPTYPENINLELESGQTFKIQYLINNERVSYKEYIEKFNLIDVNTRGVEISYQGQFGLSVRNYENANIYYGTSTTGSQSGGRIKFQYH